MKHIWGTWITWITHILKEWIYCLHVKIEVIIFKEGWFSSTPSEETFSSSKMYEFENVLSQLGSFGAYQRRVFVLVSMFETPVAWAMLLPIFLNVVPEWECPGSSSNVSTSFNSSSNSNITLPKEQCTGSGSPCLGAVFSGDLNTIVSEVWQIEDN